MSSGGRGRSISVKDKWKKTKWLLSDRVLRNYVPETKPFTSLSLKRMIGRYKMVYFKPTTGSGGNGIARIVRASSRKFQVRKDRNTYAATSASLFGRLKAIARGRRYLLQKGIYLKACRGRPFDLRMTMQKTAKGRWVPTVMFVKLGKPGKVVTNYHQGGKLALVDGTLRRAGYTQARTNGYKRLMKMLGMRTARCFDRRSKRFYELGLDIALDRSGRLWILEVNTRPNFTALKSLADKSLYRTIVRYGRQYGRTR
ncbi:YheC/YheD family protein [Paenibacillus montanisoli]|uniref:YheC/YheD family protein n=1 Tax=Paenibacillus montanisoli TaxID=2081970 RepID=A0A328U2R6_9BACL|nr:YheC/YheD family protein [Paenibacillus montanisoli]RAP74206.1 YheC/YheD family protein [Paenibacillus montanisoli]